MSKYRFTRNLYGEGNVIVEADSYKEAKDKYKTILEKYKDVKDIEENIKSTIEDENIITVSQLEKMTKDEIIEYLEKYTGVTYKAHEYKKSELIELVLE